MDQLLVLATGALVTLLTGGVKKLLPVLGQLKKGWFRVLVALLSYAATIGHAALSGGEVDQGATETFVNALTVFATSQATYLLFKRKKEEPAE